MGLLCFLYFSKFIFMLWTIQSKYWKRLYLIARHFECLLIAGNSPFSFQAWNSSEAFRYTQTRRSYQQQANHRSYSHTHRYSERKQPHIKQEIRCRLRAQEIIRSVWILCLNKNNADLLCSPFNAMYIEAAAIKRTQRTLIDDQLYEHKNIQARGHQERLRGCTHSN